MTEFHGNETGITNRDSNREQQQWHKYTGCCRCCEGLWYPQNYILCFIYLWHAIIITTVSKLDTEANSWLPTQFANKIKALFWKWVAEMVAPPPASGDENQLMSLCLAHTPRYTNDIYIFPRLRKPVTPKGNEPWIFTGRTDAEGPVLWPSNAKNWLTGKDSDAGKDRQAEKGATEDEMVGWHHRLDGHEFERTPGDSEGQRSLACCSPWGHSK